MFKPAEKSMEAHGGGSGVISVGVVGTSNTCIEQFIFISFLYKKLMKTSDPYREVSNSIQIKRKET